MTKTQLIATAAGYGLTVDDKDTKETLLEKVAEHLNAEEKIDELEEFLDANGYAIDDNGKPVKKTKRRTLGENPNTKAYHTIKVLQDENLAHLSYPELAQYLKEAEGIETKASSIAWYANWLKTKGKHVVARSKTKKSEEAPAAEAEAEEV